MPQVDVSFQCLPLRSLGRLDIPIDASPGFRAQCERIKSAVERHGLHNSYYVYDARCRYSFTNDPQIGMLEFAFEGTLLTDDADLQTVTADLEVSLVRETCEWLTEPVGAWVKETGQRAARVEFGRYIAAGGLEKAKQRGARVAAETEESGGYLGMYL